MQRQLSFSELEYTTKRKQTRRDRFLAEIKAVTPWAELMAVIEPHYPKGEQGRPPIGLERMLRMYIAQNCFGFGFGDEAMEEAIFEAQAIRHFVGVDLRQDEAPDATTLLTFRHLLEEHKLTGAIFQAINANLAEQGLMLRQGTVVDATIIAAPSSTKNQAGERDPEMLKTRKGTQWHFVRYAHAAPLHRQPSWPPAAASLPGGMKAHVGVDAYSVLVHTVVGTATNETDVTHAHELLHGQEQAVFADAGDPCADKREEVATKAPYATWYIALRPGKRKRLPEGSRWAALIQQIEQLKARVRAKVEHPFHVVKNLFRHRKTRYKGLAKNTAHLFTLFGLANLVLARRWLLNPAGQSAS